MSTTLTYSSRISWKKALPIVALATAMLLVAGFSYLSVTKSADAAKPSDFGLKEGNTISASGSDDPDVYIINDAGYKRLFLNPVIFGFYGHLGGFANVKSVSPATRDAFGTSGLFRNCETNDERVYGVESTGEDTATLHWVNTTGAAAVAADPNFFQKVFCINNNEFNWYAKGTDYTSISQVPNYSRTPGVTPTPTATTASGPVSLNLSANNPAASTVTLNATGVTYLVATATGNGTINQITLKRGGAGATGDFTNVYIYDGSHRLTSGKTLSSSDGTVTFANLNIAVNGTKELTFTGDMAGASAHAGDVNYLSITEALITGGSVANLPIRGNNMTLAGASSGTISVDKTGSLSNPNVGAKGAEILQFKLTASTENATVKRIALIQGGNLKGSDLSNVVMKSGTNSWPGVSTSDGYLVFDLGTGASITKGNSVIFHVYADLGGKKGDTVALYFDVLTDVLAIGDQFGYGMNTDITNLDTTAEATTLTLQGGVLTLNYDPSLSAQNIGTNTSDTVFLKYSMSAATAIEVRKTRLVLCEDTGGNGTFDNANNASGWSDLVDIKIANADNGIILVGPQDGTAFTTSNTTVCPSGATGAAKDFTDVFTLNGGQTLNLRVTADVRTANTGGFQVASGDIIKIVLASYGTLTGTSGDSTVMKYSGTSTAVTSADIVPAADISGPNMTVQSSALTLGLAGSPISQTFVRGTQNVNATGFTFQSTQASDLKVTDITLTGYVKDSAGDSYTLGVGANGDANMKVGNLIGTVSLYEAESGALISQTPTSNNLGNSTGTVVFNSLNWNIPAGTTRTLLVRTNLSSNATSGSSDFMSFDINNTSDVTALDNNSNTVNPSTSDPNGATSPVRVLTIANSGSITTSLSPASPNKKALYWGQTGEEISRFQFAATNEGQYIQNLTVGALPSVSANHSVANTGNVVKSVYLTYTNKAGQTLTANQPLTNGASANFGFTINGTSDTRPYIPKDSTTDIIVKVDIKAKSEGLGNSQNNVIIGLDLSKSFNNDKTQGIKFVGEGSGVTTDGTQATSFSVGAKDMYVYRVFPQIDQVALAAPYNLIGNPDVLKFTVTAKGLPDANLFFDNTAAASGSIKFAVIASGEYVQATSTSYQVYGIDDNTLYDHGNIKADARGGTAGAPVASLSFAFADRTLKIPGGSSKTFRISLTNPNANYAKPANGTSGRAADYFQLILRDTESNLISWVANSTGVSSDVDTRSTSGTLRTLPLNGPTFQR